MPFREETSKASGIKGFASPKHLRPALRGTAFIDLSVAVVVLGVGADLGDGGDLPDAGSPDPRREASLGSGFAESSPGGSRIAVVARARLARGAGASEIFVDRAVAVIIESVAGLDLRKDLTLAGRPPLSILADPEAAFAGVEVGAIAREREDVIVDLSVAIVVDSVAFFVSGGQDLVVAGRPGGGARAASGLALPDALGGRGAAVAGFGSARGCTGTDATVVDLAVAVVVSAIAGFFLREDLIATR